MAQNDLEKLWRVSHGTRVDSVVEDMRQIETIPVFWRLFEVWNPGQLPPPLTPEKLRHPHSSIPRNHRVCETLFLARYIEKFGTGTP